MRLTEFKESGYSLHRLDYILLELCCLIIEGQKSNPKKYGMVAACVLGPNNQSSTSTSTYKDSKWHHAERNAIENYTNRYGEIPKGSIIIVTLSPCSEFNDITSSERAGLSCTELINSSTIRNVYCGYIDPTQGDDHHSNHQFTLKETQNTHIRELCEKFANTFLKP